MSVTVGFIGFGNMGKGIATGLVREGFDAQHILAYSPDADSLVVDTAALGACAATSNEQVVQESDIVIIAVKPYLVETVLTPLKNLIDESKTLISIAWGINNAQMEEIVPGTHHCSIIPNMPIAVGQGVLVAEREHTLTAAQYTQVRELFANVGLWQEVETDHMSVAGIVTSCSPAYMAMVVEALADAGVKYGLTRSEATRLAAGMMQGSGAQIVEQPIAPAALKDAVCSPGGATIRGVVALEQAGLRGDITRAIEAVMGK